MLQKTKRTPWKMCGQVMESLFIVCYLIVFFGMLALIGNAVDKLWTAHKRGLARVRAYDLRQGK